MPKRHPDASPRSNPNDSTSISDDAPLAQACLSPREIHFENDGTRLFAVELGAGPPLVFLHGGLADHRAALLRLRSVGTDLRLVTPDLRGSGRSIDANELDWDRLADDVVALLAHLGIERAIVGGISMGSGVALRFALRHPESLHALVLMSPVYPGADRPLAQEAGAAMRALGEAGERVVRHGVEALRPLFETLPPPVREVALEMMLGFDPASVGATSRFLASGVQPMATARDLGAIEVPVMVLPGVDPQHPAEVAALYAEHLRDVVLVESTDADWLERLVRFCVTAGAA